MLPALAATVFAIVTQDGAALRAAPSATAPKNAVLYQGAALEVRGARAGYLRVYDYQRERGGYVLEWQVRSYDLEATSSASLMEHVRLLRDIQGMEALGIGHAALYLKQAAPRDIGAEVFDALGTMADRLARRAALATGASGSVLSGHLDVARGYGIGLVTVEEDGRTRTCYDGEAFRRVFALGGTPEQMARAVLGLTRPGCETGTPSERQASHEWAAQALQALPLERLPLPLQHKLRLRRAAMLASLAFERGRAGKAAEAQAAAARAIGELALVDRAELAEWERDAYSDAAVHVGAARAAAERGAAAARAALSLRFAARAPGETCLTLVEERSGAARPALERCTYGQVWPGSVRVAPRGQALSLAVQPLDGWRELWVFHRAGEGWAVDVVTPAAETGLGYVEWAGWTPDGAHVLAAREARVNGRFARSFELLRLDTMTVERKAERPQDLTAFYRWQAPEWKAETLALR
jgi:hypothetical protein